MTNEDFVEVFDNIASVGQVLEVCGIIRRRVEGDRDGFEFELESF